VFSHRQSGPVPAFLSSGVPERASGDRGWPGLAGWIKAQIQGETKNQGRDWAEYRHPDVKNGRQGPSQGDGWRCSYLTQIRGFSWHNNEIKMIRRGYYSSNNFQDSNKRKRTKSKTIGYLPRVFFFNAFELGSVIQEDSHIRNMN
jgi:hypothetical protein